MNKMRSLMRVGHDCPGSFPCSSYARVSRCASLQALRAARNAFSLIEVMLAMMVISVGLLAIMSLFPMSLDQNARAVANGQAALFADELLNGIRACADENWDGLDGSLELPVAAVEFWDGAPANRFSLNGTNLMTNLYNLAADTNLMNHVVRYRMALVTNGNIKAVTLWVWSGQYGVTSAPIVFYAEYFNGHPTNGT